MGTDSAGSHSAVGLQVRPGTARIQSETLPATMVTPEVLTSFIENHALDSIKLLDHCVIFRKLCGFARLNRLAAAP